MEVVLTRTQLADTYTIGRICLESIIFCNSLEDKDRGLLQSDSLSKIKKIKVAGETAVPRGTYELDLDTVSLKYKAVAWFNNLCGGKMPRLLNVPGYEGVLIHPGNTALDTNGCILVGRNTSIGRVTSSRDCFKGLYNKLEDWHSRGQQITITIN